MEQEIRYLSAQEIRDLGILQEANRGLFHPLGLAAEVDLETGTLRIQDHTNDPEGMIYAAGVMAPEKYKRFCEFRESRHAARKAALGFVQQPLDF